MEGTPSKQVNLSLTASSEPGNGSLSLSLTYAFLRKMPRSHTESCIQHVNTSLKTVQLCENESLEDRLACESRKVASYYTKVKGGNNKNKFDLKLKTISISENDINSVVHLLPSVSTPDLQRAGVRIDNASKTHKTRLVKNLKTDVGKVLDFTETYGVIPKKMMCETFSGESCVFNIDGCSDEYVAFDNMSSVKQTDVRQMLNICDTNMISDAAYHEIAMHAPSLPRKSHVISCRQEMNTHHIVHRTPGMLSGSNISIESDLTSTLIRMEKQGIALPQKLKIKVSGDGAKVSKVSNFVVMSYSFVGLSDDTSQSHKSQCVVAIVNCDENYLNLKNSLRPLFEEINKLNREGSITAGDKTYDLELFIGGDMKFIQLLLGLNSSIATYACPWCKIPKENRGDISLPANHYHSPEHFRSIKELKEIAISTIKQKFGSKHSPLLDIEVDHYVPDELHLLMRVTDVLLRNLMFDAQSKDQYGKINGQSTDNLSILMTSIQACGVTFKTWISRSGVLDWTSLSGNDKKKLLKHLPDKLVFCLHTDTRDHVVALWRQFAQIYDMMTSTTDHDGLHTNVKCFLEKFLEIGYMKRVGYQSHNVTPYLHVLLYHVPFFVASYGKMSQFSGQGVEKTNDVLKQIHQVKSNKQDATSDALLTRKRIENHGEQREKRKYQKQSPYWESGIFKLRDNKKRKIENEIRETDLLYRDTVTEQIDYSSLSVKELKEKLGELGITTKLRKKEKLLELLKHQLDS